MTRKPKSANTQNAKDRLPEGSSGKAQAQHQAGAAPATAEVVAAVSAPHSDGPVSARDDAAAQGQPLSHPAAGDNPAADQGPLPEVSPSPAPVSPAPSSTRLDGATMDFSSASPEAGAGAGGGHDMPPAERVVWVVTCFREGGMRRAGRRWSQGDTPVEHLTDEELAALEASADFALERLVAPLLPAGG